MSGSEPEFGLPKNWDKIPAEERKQLQKPLIFPNHEKLFRRFTLGATIAMTVYMVFFHKYRSEDHCFQPMRKWVKKQREDFFALGPDDLKYVEDYKEELKKQ